MCVREREKEREIAWMRLMATAVVDLSTPDTHKLRPPLSPKIQSPFALQYNVNNIPRVNEKNKLKYRHHIIFL